MTGGELSHRQLWIILRVMWEKGTVYERGEAAVVARSENRWPSAPSARPKTTLYHDNADRREIRASDVMKTVSLTNAAHQI